MYRVAQIVLALLLILGTGLVHGMWTNRWRVAHELEAAAARLEQVPENIGAWTASPEPLDAGSLARAGAIGSWSRTYRCPGSGAVFTVILLCGRAGKMSVHRPEDCYRAAGYDVITPIQRLTLSLPDSSAPQLRTALFSKAGPAGPSTLRIFWTWYTGSDWQAPDSPRVTFAHLPALYKLYVIRALARPEERLDTRPDLAFLEQLLPELDRALSVAETKPAASVVSPLTIEPR
jgi:hypothetical protein